MSTAVMFSSRKWRRMAMALQPQQLSSSMVTPGAKRGRAGHRQHLARVAGGSETQESHSVCRPLWNLPGKCHGPHPTRPSGCMGTSGSLPHPQTLSPSPLGCYFLTGSPLGLVFRQSYDLLAFSFFSLTTPALNTCTKCLLQATELPALLRSPDAPLQPCQAPVPDGPPLCAPRTPTPSCFLPSPGHGADLASHGPAVSTSARPAFRFGTDSNHLLSRPPLPPLSQSWGVVEAS